MHFVFTNALLVKAVEVQILLSFFVIEFLKKSKFVRICKKFILSLLQFFFYKEK